MPSGLLIAGGLVALIVGADVLVRAGSGLASWLGVRPMMIGLTVVSLGTSVPELAIAEELRRVAPLARPNGSLIAIADRLMQREGRMWRAFADTFAILAWVEVYENVPFELDSSFLS